jgi:RNA polymerase sigma-70 factor (ECF subfamily)
MAFPDTRPSVIIDLSHDSAERRERALDLVARAYRAPMVAAAQRRWSMPMGDAEDLVQDFFAQAIAKGWFARYDAARGRFRTFLRSCLWAYASTVYDTTRRRKRGGGAEHVSLDAATDQASVDPEVDAVFDREWMRSVLEVALDGLRLECLAAGRELTWEVFRMREVEGAVADDSPSYKTIADRLQLPETQVTNYLNWARRRFRSHVLDTLRALTASDEEFREEARLLLGVDR